jgi:hypothetical protein
MIRRDRPVDTVTIARAVAPMAIIAFAATILFLFPPAQYSFYPRCPIHEFLHLECPGCGTIRALAALLHGRLAEAFRFNALIVSLLPVAGAYAIRCYIRFLQRRPLLWLQMPPAATYLAFAATILFTVMRNLPLYRF